MTKWQKEVLMTFLATATLLAGAGGLLWGIFGLLFIPKCLWFLGGMFALIAVITYCWYRVENTAQKPTPGTMREWRGPQ